MQNDEIIDAVKYVTSTFTIEVNNAYIITDIEDELAVIPNKKELFRFMRENKDHIDLKFKNGFDRFIKLCKLYKTEMNRERIEKADKEASALAEKFREIKPFLKNELTSKKSPCFDEVHIADGGKYFSKFEQFVLGSIGDVRRVCKLDDEFKLEEEISKIFQKIVMSSVKTSGQLAISGSDGGEYSKNTLSAITTAIQRF